MTRDTPDPEPGETSPGPIPMHRLMASYRFDDDLARVLTAFQTAPPTLGATEARVRVRVAVVSTVETQHTAWVCRPDSYSLCITDRRDTSLTKLTTLLSFER